MAEFQLATAARQAMMEVPHCCCPLAGSPTSRPEVHHGCSRQNRFRITSTAFALLLVATSLPAQNTGLSPYGDGICGSDFVPTFHTGGEMPVLGNASFQAISDNLIGGTPGVLWISPNSANIPLPGMTILVDPANSFMLPCQASGTSSIPGDGIATLSLPL